MKLRSYIAALHAALFAILLAISPAGSGSMMLMGVGAPAGGSAFSLVFGSSASSSNTSLTTIDFGTLTYGAGCTRVVVASQWYVGGTISNVTIGGVSLSQISGAHVATTAIAADAWESSAALAGTSGDVQVTFSAAQSFVASVALYCLNTTSPAASATNTQSNISATVLTAPIAVPAGGGGLVISQSSNGHTATFGNATVDADIVTGGTNQYYGHTTATGAISVTATYSVSDNIILSVVSWAP